MADLNSLTFGSDDAELDDKRGFLSKVFLKTSFYERVKSKHSQLVLGRKGAGKSAICLMLDRALQEDQISSTIVSPDSLSQSKLKQLKTDSINEEEAYVLAWRYVLLVVLAVVCLEHTEELRTDSNKKKFRVVRSFLVQNKEIAGNFIEEILAKISSVNKISVSVASVEGSVETNGSLAQQAVSDKLELFQKNLIALLKSCPKLNTGILIDKVDDVWNETHESKMMIIGLLKAVHKLNANMPQTQFILFMRSDIYNVLKFNDLDKFRSLEEVIKWSRKDLKRLIGMRIKISSNLDENDIDTLWSMFFPATVKGKDSFDYIVERTLMRPREIIQFCNRALIVAQDNKHTTITREDVLQAERIYSNWKLKDISSEFLVQYPYLDNILGMFHSFKEEFSVQEFKDRYNEISERVISAYPSLQKVQEIQILQSLFIIGFLGTKRAGQVQYVYDDPLIVLAQSKTVQIHPVYHKALSIIPTIKRELDRITVRIEGNGNIVGDNNRVGRGVHVGGNVGGSIITGDDITPPPP